MTPRIQSLNAIGVLVKDYDDAITFFTDKLNFELIANEAQPNEQRWVFLRPPGSSGPGIVLNLATTQSDLSAIGKQAGDHVFAILQTNDFWRDYHAMQSSGITFLEVPRTEPYGTVAIFADLYGNKWDLIQSST